MKIAAAAAPGAALDEVAGDALGAATVVEAALEVLEPVAPHVGVREAASRRRPTWASSARRVAAARELVPCGACICEPGRASLVGSACSPSSMQSARYSSRSSFSR